MTDMSQSLPAKPEAPAGRVPLQWMTRKRLMFAGAAAVVGSGMAMNWGWLTAIGAAPLIVAFAPCAAMCGLGLCMKGGTGKGCSKSTDAPASD